MAPILHMALEDELSDILKKARTGQQRSVADVACASGLPEIELTELERGLAPRRRDQVLAVAQALGLRAEPLAQVSDGWTPHELPASLAHVEIVLGSIQDGLTDALARFAKAGRRRPEGLSDEEILARVSRA